ncbi:MAG TPA: hypothetical protein VFV46_07300 [Lacibacter sp.]|nr:hypothetical protein [Lacibacter sp.]
MKKPILFLAFVLGLFSASAQSFEGTWKGTMLQDSPVARIDFEMVLEQKEGKINGYLYRLFIVNDSLIYNTVRVTARVSDNMLIVEDEESVSRNFEERANRKIKAAYFFKLEPQQPYSDTLKGEWTTSRFKNKYMSVSGKVSIRREIFYETTQLFKRLEEKQLHTTIAFVPKKTAPDIAVNKTGNTTQPQTAYSKTTEPKPQSNAVVVTTSQKKDTVATTVAINDPLKKNRETKTNQTASTSDTKQQPSNVASNNKPSTTGPVKKDSIQNSTVVNNTKPATNPVTTQKSTNNPVADSKTSTKPTAQPSDNIVKTNTEPKKDSVQTTAGVKSNPEQKNNSINQPKPQPSTTSVATNTQQKPTNQNKTDTNNAVVKNNTQPLTTNKPVQQPVAVNNPVTTPPTEPPSTVLIKTDEATVKDSSLAKQKPIATVAPPVINNPIITKRETEVIQTLSVFEDSITLSLYDNGEIDGDTVSVFLNNEKIINNIGLKASAYKHTIYFKPGETIQLTLFAENLGKIPPNSGLLVVYSGDQRYQVFFTSTLSKSAVVLLKRE